jgi:2,3-bisphosphoglycerate-dependent phosphoglycerate mutase
MSIDFETSIFSRLQSRRKLCYFYFMKNLRLLSLLLIVFASSIVSVSAQEQTFLLFRHAEKDTSPTADKKNPNLMETGKARADKLLQMLKVYKPQEVYSTIYNRTRQTVMPLAIETYEAFRLKIEIYDSSEQPAFVDKLILSNSKCTVIVGHSNTIPALANLLVRETKYKELADSEYNKLWIIRLKKKAGKPYQILEARVVEY